MKQLITWLRMRIGSWKIRRQMRSIMRDNPYNPDNPWPDPGDVEG